MVQSTGHGFRVHTSHDVAQKKRTGPHLDQFFGSVLEKFAYLWTIVDHDVPWIHRFHSPKVPNKHENTERLVEKAGENI